MEINQSEGKRKLTLILGVLPQASLLSGSIGT